MELAIVENNFIKTLGNSFELFPNVSFSSSGIDVEFMASNSVLPVQRWEAFDKSTEKLDTVEPYITGDKVLTYIKRLKTEAELQEDALKLKTAKESEVRGQRNQLLKDSDWTQVADAPVDKDAWATYRQTLRDVTSQEGFPFNVVFPNPPL